MQARAHSLIHLHTLETRMYLLTHTPTHLHTHTHTHVRIHLHTYVLRITRGCYINYTLLSYVICTCQVTFDGNEVRCTVWIETVVNDKMINDVTPWCQNQYRQRLSDVDVNMLADTVSLLVVLIYGSVVGKQSVTRGII